MEREQVVKGMEEVVRDFKDEIEEWGYFTPDEMRGGISVDCDWYYAVMQKCEAGLEQLKRDAPRVLTLEEVKRLAHDDDVWIEYHELAGWTISAVTVRENYGDGMLCRLQSLRFGFDRYGSYGGDWMAWRCWTSRPTDEQREAVKWE